jgi:hypothetical protein
MKSKETMKHAEKSETPEMESKYHGKAFLKKALAKKMSKKSSK